MTHISGSIGTRNTTFIECYNIIFRTRDMETKLITYKKSIFLTDVMTEIFNDSQFFKQYNFKYKSNREIFASHKHFRVTARNDENNIYKINNE